MDKFYISNYVIFITIIVSCCCCCCYSSCWVVGTFVVAKIYIYIRIFAKLFAQRRESVWLLGIFDKLLGLVWSSNFEPFDVRCMQPKTISKRISSQLWILNISADPAVDAWHLNYLFDIQMFILKNYLKRCTFTDIAIRNKI